MCVNTYAMPTMKREALMTRKPVKIYFGPQHPGITGNMMMELDMDGETIIKAKTHIGYLHRAFEKLMERRNYLQNFTIVCRICVPEPDINEETYTLAVEHLANVEVPERAKYIRVIVLELARLVSYIMWSGGQAASMGLYTIPQWVFADRDYLIDLFEELSGARIYHMYIWPGGVRRDLPANWADKLLNVLDYTEKRLKDYDKLFFNNEIFLKRSKGVGVINPENIRERGIVGPLLRACGIAEDIRVNNPYEVYNKLQVNIITEQGGDIYARAMVRRREMQQSIDIIREAINDLPTGPFYRRPFDNPFNFKIEPGQTYQKIESARGEYGYFLVSDGTDKPRRVHVRGPGFVHAFTLLEKLLIGNKLADVPIIMTSLGICPPEIER